MFLAAKETTGSRCLDPPPSPGLLLRRRKKNTQTERPKATCGVSSWSKFRRTFFACTHTGPFHLAIVHLLEQATTHVARSPPEGRPAGEFASWNKATTSASKNWKPRTARQRLLSRWEQPTLRRQGTRRGMCFRSPVKQFACRFGLSSGSWFHRVGQVPISPSPCLLSSRFHAEEWHAWEIDALPTLSCEWGS